MANLVVRNVDDDIVNALKERAGRKGHSAEAEHRLILRSALLKTKKKTFATVFSSMPNVGEDSDFQRRNNIDDTDVFN